MGSAFHRLCPRYSGNLTPTAPTTIRLWETFTFTYARMCDLAKRKISKTDNEHLNINIPYLLIEVEISYHILYFI